MNAVAAKDVEALAGLYTDDGRLMFAHAPVIEGKENIKAFFKQSINAGISGVKLTTEEVTGTNDFAIESGQYAMMVGDQTVDKGQYLVHWKKVGGKWRLHRDMPSSGQPAAQAIAQPDQTVGIAVFKVKKGKVDEFESFFRNVIIPACDTSTPVKREALKSVRMLRSNEIEKDGSEKFIFIFDPRYDEMEYELETILVGKHGQEKGKQFMDQLASYTTDYYDYHNMKQLAPN